MIYILYQYDIKSNIIAFFTAFVILNLKQLYISNVQALLVLP